MTGRGTCTGERAGGEERGGLSSARGGAAAARSAQRAACAFSRCRRCACASAGRSTPLLGSTVCKALIMAGVASSADCGSAPVCGGSHQGSTQRRARRPSIRAATATAPRAAAATHTPLNRPLVHPLPHHQQHTKTQRSALSPRRLISTFPPPDEHVHTLYDNLEAVRAAADAADGCCVLCAGDVGADVLLSCALRTAGGGGAKTGREEGATITCTPPTPGAPPHTATTH